MSDPSVVNSSQKELEATVLSARPWVKYYEPGVPIQLDIPDHPLTWLLDQAASRYPQRTALIYYGTKISYAQLSTLVKRFALALQRLGVQKGDRVALALPNIPQYPIAFYGTLKAGAIAVPTNPLYTEREMQHQLADSGARVLVMLDMFYPVVRAVRDRTSLEQIIITSPADFLPPVLRVLYPLSQRRARLPEPRLTPQELRSDAMLRTMSEMLEPHTKGGVEVFNLPEPAGGNELAVLQYTGGTTGLSKGAMLTHRNLLANALQTRHWTPRAHDGEEIGLCVAPFFHSYGMTVCMNLGIYAGATLVLLPKFSPKEVVRAIARYRPTMFAGIPTMYIAVMRELKGHSDRVQSVKYCISGAAPLPAKVQEDFERMSGGKVVEGYGLSETSPVTHCNPLNENCVNGSVGLPLPNIDAMIMDSETGKALPPGEIGEIMVKGPNVMKGYWNREDETRAIFRDGWLHTGDLGYMDEKGYFYIADRSKDLIIASGFNIYPREVEEVLYRHEAILEAAVVGVPDEYRGENVAAVIVLKPGFTASDEMRNSIVAYCKKELAAYKVPKIVEFREDLPKSLIGKVLRREVRAMLAKPEKV
ncbi:MAG TPA: long-chain fatty acid--CoA ligase [Ktedonobacteraceae bacterium]|nr:long-chain fatty acid--CoA ligase [Ktedonobacteraceae bacterium]